MAPLTQDTNWQNVKYLHLYAFQLKSLCETNASLILINDAWQDLQRIQAQLEPVLAIDSIGNDLFRQHYAKLSEVIGRDNPLLCIIPLIVMCAVDIPKMEQAYLQHLEEQYALDLEEQKWSSIHPVIRLQAQSRFQTQHYADAVEAAFKEINKLVKAAYRAISGDELDGDALMRKAFSYVRASRGNPERLPALLITDRDLTTDSGFNVQDGYMNLFAGAMRGIRNPKAHDNINIDESEAWEMLVFGSHLMRMWDRGQQASFPVAQLA